MSEEERASLEPEEALPEPAEPEDERARVLRMVAEGTVSPEEGAELLEALASGRPEAPRAPAPPPVVHAPHPIAPLPLGAPRRSLVIRIEEGGESKVNIRIPIGLFRAAGRFVPRRAQNQLREYGIDLDQLLAELTASPPQGGPLVEIEDDEDKVHIAVE